MSLRVPKAELTPELGERMIQQFGDVLEPVEVMWHSRKVAEANLELGGKVSEWDAVDEASSRSRTWPSRRRLAVAGAST